MTNGDLKKQYAELVELSIEIASEYFKSIRTIEYMQDYLPAERAKIIKEMSKALDYEKKLKDLLSNHVKK